MRDKVHGTVIRERGAQLREIGAGSRRAASATPRPAPSGPGLTLEDGTLVVTDNYLKVRIPPELAGTCACASVCSPDGAGRPGVLSLRANLFFPHPV